MDPAAGSSFPWSSHPQPPTIDRPEEFVGDGTCHGLLGSTLRRALEELLQLQEVAGLGEEDAAPTTPTKLAGERGRASRKKTSSGDDDDDDGMTSDHDQSMQGSAAEPNSSRRRAASARRPQLTPDMVAPILTSLGHAMLKTHEDRCHNVPPSEWVSGVVRGRVDYYCRRGSKWRVVTDPGAQVRLIRPQQRRRLAQLSTPLPQHPSTTPRHGTRGYRKKQRASLWEAAAAATGTAVAAATGTSGSCDRDDNVNVTTLVEPLEILAYNDNE